MATAVSYSEPQQRFIETMRAIQGALIVASSIQIILGYSQVWGLFSRFFSPLGMAPVVGLVGFGLFHRGFPELGKCVEIGLPMLLLVIGVSQYLKFWRPAREMPVFEHFPVLICVTIIWIYSIILTASGAYRYKPIKTQFSCRTDKANLISTAPWFKFPYPLQWGPLTFSVGHSCGMMSAVLVSMIEDANYGVNIIANSNLSDGSNGWNPLGNCTLIVANLQHRTDKLLDWYFRVNTSFIFGSSSGQCL